MIIEFLSETLVIKSLARRERRRGDGSRVDAIYGIIVGDRLKTTPKLTGGSIYTDPMTIDGNIKNSTTGIINDISTQINTSQALWGQDANQVQSISIYYNTNRVNNLQPNVVESTLQSMYPNAKITIDTNSEVGEGFSYEGTEMNRIIPKVTSEE